jgi:homoserine kinase
MRGDGRVRVRVPATSANLGPGFDALGVALSIYNRFEAEEADSFLIEGGDGSCEPEDNLFVRAYRVAMEELGLPSLGLKVRFDADIPVARGLGSSSACIVGGMLTANALHGGGLDRARMLDLAAGLEGHPDNVAPAIFGGFAASVLEGGRVIAAHSPIGEGLVFNALVPPFRLETARARAALPKELSFADAVFNVGRAALVAASFATRDFEALGAACKDRLHEDFRAPLIPGFREVVEAARRAGALAVFLSGAGPTVMAICRAGDTGFAESIAPFLASRLEGAWDLLSLIADDQGATLEG